LHKAFPGEDDIVRCKNACYVKGRLQPTRSFGDFYLKYKEYNFTRLAVFTGPYIEATPLVTHFALKDEHKNLILASDGLWDELDEVEIHKVYRAKGPKFGMAVFDAAMDKILRRNRLNSIHDLNKISYRRDLHDDITIVNVDLQELRKSLNNSK
jgi:pyruvate dehydrogenase phosphatase